MGTLSLLLLFARTQLQRSLAPRRSWLVYAFTLLPALVAFLIAARGRHATAEGIATNLSWFLYLQVVVPLVTLLAGQAVISREVEDRTITYLFSRPISRPVMFVGRTLGALAFTLLVLELGALLLLLAAAQGSPGRTPSPEHFPLASWGADGITLPLLGAVALGALAYTLLFSALGVLTKHPMILGLAYSFAIEGFLSNLPGSNQALAVQYYLRSWVAAHADAGWSHVEGFSATTYEEPGRVLFKLALVAILALVLGSWRIRTKEFVLSS